MKEGYLCLNCWRASSRQDAFFRCESCDTAARPDWMQRRAGALRRVRDVRRPFWAALFADDRGGPCARHPKASYQLFCECGYLLTERAAVRGGAPMGLGIAGPRSSGKTLLVITMMHELHRLEVAGHRLGLVGLDDTEARFHRLSADFFDHGDKPHATAPEEAVAASWDDTRELPPGNFCWTVALEGQRRVAPLLLAVNDLGGETWGLRSDERRERFDRYLGHLGSLVFLVDGTSMAADLGIEVRDAWDRQPPAGDRGASTRQWFSRIEERLANRARKIDLAIVISKADSLWEHDEGRALRAGAEIGDEDRQDVLARLLEASHRRSVVIDGRQRFRRVRLFAVSSLGFRPTRDDVDKRGRLKRPVDPAGVTEPVAWLLRQRLGFR